VRESDAVRKSLKKIERLVGELSKEVALLKEERLALAVSTLHHSLGLESRVRLPGKIRCFEITLIAQALELSDGSQKRAADLLGLGPTTLHAKIKRYKMRSAAESTDPN
jgi:DNA-binding NtrC family response regulator